MLGSPQRASRGRAQAFVRPAPVVSRSPEGRWAAAPPPPPPPRRIELAAEPVAPPGIGSYVIALGVIMAMTGAVVAGGWIGDAQPAFLVGVVGVVEAILLGRAGIGRLEALLFGLPLCAAVVVPVTIGVLPASVSALGWYHVVGEYALQAFAGLLAAGPGDFVNWAFLVGLGALVWGCGYWLGWVAFREHRGVLAILPALVVLAVNSLNAPAVSLTSGAGSSVGLPETLAIFAAILLVGMSELGGLGAVWQWRRVPAMSGLRGRFTASLTVVALGVVLVSLLLPPVTGVDIVNFFAGLGGRGNGPGHGAGQTSLIGFSTEVTPGGPLVSNPRPVLSYYTGSGDPAYLAIVTDDSFADGNWTSGFHSRADTSVRVDATAPIPQQSLGLARSPVTAHITFAATSGVSNPGPSPLVPFPAEPYSLSIGSLVSGMAAQSSGTAGVIASGPSTGGYYCVGNLCSEPAATAASGPLETVDSVTVGSASRGSGLTSTGERSTATIAQLEQAGTDYPQWLRQLFPTSPGTAWLTRDSRSANAAAQARQIQTLAQSWVKGVAADPYDEATAIQEELRSSAFGYTLSPPQGPSGTWPIVYFLTKSREGYCQYFASAMGAMLWSLGIPARLVSGFGPGTTSATSLTNNGQQIFQVSTSDAHVWVEVYFPTYGWVPFEPTASSNTGGTYGDFPRGQTSSNPAATAPAGSIHNNRPLPTQHTGTSGPPKASGPGAAWWGGLGGGLAAVMVLVLLSLRWWRRPRSLAGVWRRLAIAGRLAGVDRDPAETRPAYALRLAQAFGGSGPPLLALELDRVAAVSGKAEFALGGLEPTDRELWVSTWRRLARALTRLLRRRLLRRQPAV